MTTGSHLHMEVLQNKVHMDPVDFLNISILNFKKIPSKNKIKFYSDYREST
jgi:murein DD-endopeptidase MepM/ murein hydrolase activator NlpD